MGELYSLVKVAEAAVGDELALELTHTLSQLAARLIFDRQHLALPGKAVVQSTHRVLRI